MFTDDAEVADKLRSLRVHGKGTDKYDTVRVGMNSRLDTLQAAVLLAKLTVLDEELVSRAKIATSYHEGLNATDGVRLPLLRNSAWAQFTLRVRSWSGSRESLVAKLRNAGIATAVYYPTPLHLQPAFAYLGYTRGDFPEAERACEEVLSLPIYPGLTSEEQDDVMAALREATQV